MKEQLIEFETAKLAKEKGFDWIISDDKFYDYSGQLDFTFQGYSEGVTENGRTPAPSQSLLQKWLRDKHSIMVYLKPYWEEEYCLWRSSILMKNGYQSDFYSTYEKSLEKGLQEALKLIK